jgi:hypothetical protein
MSGPGWHDWAGASFRCTEMTASRGRQFRYEVEFTGLGYRLTCRTFVAPYRNEGTPTQWDEDEQISQRALALGRILCSTVGVTTADDQGRRDVVAAVGWGTEQIGPYRDWGRTDFHSRPQMAVDLDPFEGSSDKNTGFLWLQITTGTAGDHFLGLEPKRLKLKRFEKLMKRPRTDWELYPDGPLVQGHGVAHYRSPPPSLQLWNGFDTVSLRLGEADGVVARPVGQDGVCFPPVQIDQVIDRQRLCEILHRRGYSMPDYC